MVVLVAGPARQCSGLDRNLALGRGWVEAMAISTSTGSPAPAPLITGTLTEKGVSDT
jgi:hypothetical protein